jgi:predicted ArsR family transcriptional regulator
MGGEIDIEWQFWHTRRNERVIPVSVIKRLAPTSQQRAEEELDKLVDMLKEYGYLPKDLPQQNGPTPR